MSLYQSYRPKNFSDVVGQDFVKKVLANSCITQTFHHGYIFFGFHGIGKTTLARIFAEAVNCTSITREGNPCHQCPNCTAYDNGRMIDVVEIDAASYTGVDNIREIIDHAKFSPTQGKYKIYIIDEVHMLSKGAFNALLKTLEEPPAHAIFLLATTEIAKVPDTILSRVIRFDLTKIGEADMRGLLQKICTEEGITYENEALDMIIRRARGSLRDSLTMLEKCIFDKKVETKNVEAALHLVNSAFLRETFEACRTGDAGSIQSILETLEREATDVRQFAAQMTEWIVENIHDSFADKAFGQYRELFDLFTRIYIQSRQVSVPMDIIRMALYERIKSGNIDTKKTGKIEKKETDSCPLDKGGQEGLNREELIETKKEVPEELPELPAPSHELAAPEKELPSPEHDLPAPESELPMPEKELTPPISDLPPAEKVLSIPEEDTLPLPTHELSPADKELIPATHEISAPDDGNTFSPEKFLIKLQEGGIKTTILPLLRTAKMVFNDGTITIETTTFGKARCDEPVLRPIFLAAAETFGAKDVVFVTSETVSAPTEEGDSIDLARAIFE